MNNADQLEINTCEGGSLLLVKVVPGSSRDKIAGPLGTELKVATSAPPEKGLANLAVARTLAKALGLDRRAVVLTVGQTSPHKQFRIEGLSPGQVRARLAKI